MATFETDAFSLDRFRGARLPGRSGLFGETLVPGAQSKSKRDWADRFPGQSHLRPDPHLGPARIMHFAIWYAMKTTRYGWRSRLLFRPPLRRWSTYLPRRFLSRV